MTLRNGYVPQAGDTFDLLDFGSCTGAFATVSLPTPGSGLAWDSQSLTSNGTLAVVSSALSVPVFESPQLVSGGKVVLRWSSAAQHLYTVLVSTNLAAGFTELQTGIPATPSVNNYTDATGQAGCRFWQLKATK